MRPDDEGMVTFMPHKKVNDNMITFGTNFFDNKPSVECKENLEPYDKQGNNINDYIPIREPNNEATPLNIRSRFPRNVFRIERKKLNQKSNIQF